MTIHGRSAMDNLRIDHGETTNTHDALKVQYGNCSIQGCSTPGSNDYVCFNGFYICEQLKGKKHTLFVANLEYSWFH